jgi:hypothetical protein
MMKTWLIFSPALSKNLFQIAFQYQGSILASLAREIGTSSGLDKPLLSPSQSDILSSPNTTTFLKDLLQYSLAEAKCLHQL